MEKHAEYTLSYESFRQIFENKFNISFGYPRKDTCSFCDKIAVEISALQNDLSATIPSVQDNASIMQKIKAKELEKTLHLKKAEEFYKIKRKFRKLAKKEVNFEAVAMDFQRNLPVPNITTNDAYYRRQLNFMSFNIHVLSDSSSVFYTYDETEGKKGADDVCSMLNHFVSTVLSKDVRNLVIFCDSCSGQNKNFTVFRYLHYLVHRVKRFETVRVVFPIRGHSYMECDRNMAYVNTKSYVEIPEDWREVLLQSRVKPSPFKVVHCGKDMQFENWTEHLSNFYKPKCSIPTRPIRVLKMDTSNPNIFYSKVSYFGSFRLTNIVKGKAIRKGKKEATNTMNPPPLRNLYPTRLPVKAAKLKDLLHLSQFLGKDESRVYYDSLKHFGVKEDHGDDDDEYIDNIPIDEEF